MKTQKLFWGLGFLLAAALIILDVVGVMPTLLSAVGDVSIFSLILGLLLLSYALVRLFKGRISAIFFPLAFIFMLFERNVAFLCGLEDSNIVNNWLVLLIALLLHLGFAILLPSRNVRRGRKRYAVSCEANMLGSSTVYVNCIDFTPHTVSNQLGECTIYFQNPDSYKGGQTLTVSNDLGSMTINVPATWTVITDIGNILGALDTPAEGSNGGPVLYIKGENNLGNLEIHFV